MQRKLLLWIQKGIDYRTLMDKGPSVDRERRDRDLVRLIELGLVVQVDADGRTLPTRIAGPRARLGPDTGSGPATVLGPATAFGPFTDGNTPTRFGPETLAGQAPGAGPATEHGRTTKAQVEWDAPSRYTLKSGIGKKQLITIIAVVVAILAGCLAWWALRDRGSLPVSFRVAPAATPAASVPAAAAPA